MNYELIDMEITDGKNGNIASLEQGKNCPFDIKNCFYIFDTKDGTEKGYQADKNSEFVLVAVKGSCKIKIDDGNTVETVLLNSPRKGLYLNKTTKKEIYGFSNGAILAIFTNAPCLSEILH